MVKNACKHMLKYVIILTKTETIARIFKLSLGQMCSLSTSSELLGCLKSGFLDHSPDLLNQNFWRRITKVYIVKWYLWWFL